MKFSNASKFLARKSDLLEKLSFVRTRTETYSRLVFSLILIGIVFTLSSCNGNVSQGEPNVQATIDAAVAATDQARSAVAVTETAAAAQIQDAVNATLTAQVADNVQPTATGVPPTALPAATATPIPPAATATTVPPPPTPTPPILVILPIAGDDGNDNIRGSSPQNNGRNIILPGFRPDEVSDPMVFRDRMAIRVEVFDARVGRRDGDGIREVTFRIFADNGAGDLVYERTERQAGYCIFGGGEPDCNILFFSSQDRNWPGTDRSINSDIYLLEINIVAQNGDQTQWRVRFDIELAGGQSSHQNGAQVRINDIFSQNGRYLVDFEVSGYQAQLPGQHMHFFFDTVPPDQAGRPGNGPWQIYPVNPGEQATNPFSYFRVNDRPQGASRICVLVANPDHSVQQGTGNCKDLP